MQSRGRRGGPVGHLLFPATSLVLLCLYFFAFPNTASSVSQTNAISYPSSYNHQRSTTSPSYNFEGGSSSSSLSSLKQIRAAGDVEDEKISKRREREWQGTVVN